MLNCEICELKTKCWNDCKYPLHNYQYSRLSLTRALNALKQSKLSLSSLLTLNPQRAVKYDGITYHTLFLLMAYNQGVSPSKK